MPLTAYYSLEKRIISEVYKPLKESCQNQNKQTNNHKQKTTTKEHDQQKREYTAFTL